MKENYNLKENERSEEIVEQPVVDEYEEEESSRNLVIPIVIGLIIFVIAVAAIFMFLAGKGKKDEVDVQPEQTVEQEVVESSAIEVSEEAVVEETTVETEVVDEPVTESLSNEEWLESLNLDDVTFLIFNDVTLERKVLEDGQEYQLLDGDELACWWPLGWTIKNTRTDLSHDKEVIYRCCFFRFKDEAIADKSEITMDLDDADGNRHSATVYLSK